jgi:hypothetical protein
VELTGSEALSVPQATISSETSGLAAGWGSASSPDSPAPVSVLPATGETTLARGNPVVPAVRQLVVRAVNGGETEARMLLDPPELGMVRVRIAESEGVLRLGFEVATPAARDALLSGQAQLMALLREQGLELGELHVGLDGDPDQTSGQESRSWSGKSSATAPGISPEVAGVESSSSSPREQTSRVDLVA